MLEGFLQNSSRNPSNRSDLAFYWSYLKDAGISVDETYTDMLVNAGILESKSEVLNEIGHA